MIILFKKIYLYLLLIKMNLLSIAWLTYDNNVVVEFDSFCVCAVLGYEENVVAKNA